jgi:hypothetical protein
VKKTRDEDLHAFEIQPLNDEVLGNLSIEELEERLEMQILHVTEAQWCVIDICGVNCGSNCQADCGSNCIGNCGTLCGVDGCGTDAGGGGGGGGGGGDIYAM